MKSSCEKCESLLNLDSQAYICSYECTYCESCCDKLNNTCPNCGGELCVRPKRGTRQELIHIEKFKTRDFDELVGLFDSYRQFYNQATNLHSAKEFLSERIKKQESVIFVARRARKLIGFAQLYPAFTSVGMAGTWILNDLYIDTSERTHGTGTALVKRAIIFAKNSGALKITLETAKDNIKAQNIYNKLGFKQVKNFISYSLDFLANSKD